MRVLTPDETILGLLAAQARHGYDLLDCFQAGSQLGRVWSLSTSQIYAVLKRLEKRGFIIGQQVASDNAPTRTEYTLTDAGESQLGDWLHEPCPSASIRRVRVEFLSRLYIARELNIPTHAIVENQRAACREKLTQLVDERDSAEHGVDYLALELHISQLQAVLGWIGRCEMMPKSVDR